MSCKQLDSSRYQDSSDEEFQCEEAWYNRLPVEYNRDSERGLAKGKEDGKLETLMLDKAVYQDRMAGDTERLKGTSRAEDLRHCWSKRGRA